MCKSKTQLHYFIGNVFCLVIPHALEHLETCNMSRMCSSVIINMCSPDGFQVLDKVLRYFPYLHELVLEFTYMSNKDVELLIEALRNVPNIRRLRIQKGLVDEDCQLEEAILRTRIVHPTCRLIVQKTKFEFFFQSSYISLPKLRTRFNQHNKDILWLNKMTMNGMQNVLDELPELNQEGYRATCRTMRQLITLPKCDDLQYITSLKVFNDYETDILFTDDVFDLIIDAVESLPMLIKLALLRVDTKNVSENKFETLMEIFRQRPHIRNIEWYFSSETLPKCLELEQWNDTYVTNLNIHPFISNGYGHLHNSIKPLYERDFRIYSKTKSAMKR